MSRVQLALNVADVDAAVAFYAKLFGTQPAKRRPGYANFAIAEPPLKLVLIQSSAEAAGTLNHLGVEVGSTAEVSSAQQRLASEGVDTAPESGSCCYAVQDKVWVNDPDGAPWEIYTVLADAETPPTSHQVEGDTCGAGACATRELTPSVAGCC